LNSDLSAGGATGVMPGDEPELLRVSVVRDRGVVVVELAGEVDLVTGARLRAAMATELAARPPVLVIDLDDVLFFSSVGLSSLALAQRDAVELGVELRVVATSNRTLRPLQITGMSEALAIYASRAAALAGPNRD
jgi:anti-anti-sigma factor